MIDSAKQRIDFAIYGARRQSELLQALLRAKSRGVLVRGIVDRDLTGRNYYSSTDDWIKKLGTLTSDQLRESIPEGEEDLISKCPRPVGFGGPLQCLAYDLGDRWLLAEHASREDFLDPEMGDINHIMHNKFFVIDQRYVWTGSANISDSGTGGYNANAVVVADSPPLAALYAAEFQRLIARKRPGTVKASDGVEVIRAGNIEIVVWFSPQDESMRFGVEALIAKAQERIDIAVFYLTNKYVVSELIAAHQRGVDVRVIVDATSAQNGYSKHELLRVAGIATKVENWGGKMHMKAAAIDGEFLVLGSMNWTRAGEDINDENTLLVRSTELASSFEKFFDQLWISIPDKWMRLGQQPDPESRSSGTACTDTVDNDFDNLVDSDDPGCSSQPAPLPPLPPHRVMAKSTTDHPPRTHRLYRPVSCDRSYPDWFVCIPRTPPGRDFDCSSLPYRSISVMAPDRHRLDEDGDGRGCERYDPDE